MAAVGFLPTFIIAAVLILTSAIGTFLASYVKRKGENLATAQDIRSIQSSIESVRDEFARRLEGLRAALGLYTSAQQRWSEALLGFTAQLQVLRRVSIMESYLLVASQSDSDRLYEHVGSIYRATDDLVDRLLVASAHANPEKHAKLLEEGFRILNTVNEVTTESVNLLMTVIAPLSRAEAAVRASENLRSLVDRYENMQSPHIAERLLRVLDESDKHLEEAQQHRVKARLAAEALQVPLRELHVRFVEVLGAWVAKVRPELAPALPPGATAVPSLAPPELH